MSSSLVILIVGGFFLVRQATAGIIDAKHTSAIAETAATINRIQEQLRGTDLRTVSLDERLNHLADDAASQSGRYHVLVQGSVSGLTSQGVSPDSVPTDLTAKVGESNGMWTAPHDSALHRPRPSGRPWNSRRVNIVVAGGQPIHPGVFHLS